MHDKDIVIRKSGHAGRITLNRPKSLNALTHRMLSAIEDALLDWAKDDTVKLVVVDAAGDRAFCAGGDISQLYRESCAGNIEYGQIFWQDEYRLNALIANYPKPYVAAMNGIVMGGGVGVSMLGSHRIVTEKTLFAMPECTIGLIPDVGGTQLLANTPGYCGEYLGLTGARLKAADCLYAGLADAFVQVENLPETIKTLEETGDVSTLNTQTSPSEPGTLAQNQDSIDAVFSNHSVQEILLALDDIENEHKRKDWAQKTQTLLAKSSPLSTVVALTLIRNMRGKTDIKEALRHEYRFVSRSVAHSDFLEGIRAAVIDKDGNPAWKYKTVDSVPKDVVDMMFAPAIGGDLKL